MVTLSGGNYGGTEVEWKADGLKEDGREFMIVDNHKYVRSGDMALYDGTEA